MIVALLNNKKKYPVNRHGPLRILLVRPYQKLLVTKRLTGILNLEPLELEIVAAGVPADDQVYICDLFLEEKKPVKAFRKQLQEINPHIVGLTGYSTDSSVVKELAGFVKTHNASTVVIVGGIHATVVPSDYAIDEIDIIVRGEGGTVMGEIIKRFKEGQQLYFGEAVLCPKDPDFKEKVGALPPPWPVAQDIPIARRDLVERSRYTTIWMANHEKKVDKIFHTIASIRTSYGCKFACSFCAVPFIMHKKYLERPAEHVVSEIQNIKEDHIFFLDDETFLNEQRMAEIANLLLKRGIKKKYHSWARADTIVRHPDLFRLWKEAGLGIVYVGIEAMENPRLKDYKKRTTVEINRKAISFLHEIGLTLHANLIIHPDFTEDDFRRVEKEVKHLCTTTPVVMSFTVFSPPPGTELWDRHKHDFICEDPYYFYDCIHTILPTRLELKRFYSHFSRLYKYAWANNPIKFNRVSIPLLDVIKILNILRKYMSALRSIHKDYR